MRRHRIFPIAALLAAAIVGGVVAIVVRGGAPAPAAPPLPPVKTTTVTRTDLSTTVLTEGTLDYAASNPVVNHMTGTYTALPQPGNTVGFGQVLYRVDNTPVVLMQGATPAWRAFALGMTDGPDVGELQADLIALGYAADLLSAPDDHFGTATAAAVERWQVAEGFVPSGDIEFGQLDLLPAPILVAALAAASGQPATVGDMPYSVTTTDRTVTVPLNPDVPSVSIGETVSIILPTHTATNGIITSVVPAPAPTSSSSSAGGGQSPTASTEALVAPDDPSATGSGANVAVQVALTLQSVHDVLAAPISALLALAGGGYGVEVVRPSGVHQLVGVTTGVFTGSQVQISGSGIKAGTRIVVAQ
jgi:peptidoglycan hydrolase-like protein with peptidoglycan-binding domain